jgi:2-phospho-L-lactate guanylyltransferase (CobY/MobA/RfbA family)
MFCRKSKKCGGKRIASMQQDEVVMRDPRDLTDAINAVLAAEDELAVAQASLAAAQTAHAQACKRLRNAKKGLSAWAKMTATFGGF